MNTITGGGLPGLDGPVSECAADIAGNATICSKGKELDAMKEYLKDHNVDTSNMTNENIVALMRKKLNVNTESKIYEHYKFRKYIGGRNADNILRTEFIPPGPSNDTSLLDNNNIDHTLAQWQLKSKEKFGVKFFHIPFQMIDFAKQNTELARLRIKELMSRKYDCFGVVLNTDVSSGRGKHWFCIFCDMKHAGTPDDPITIEYFNSSGFPPRAEVVVWMEKTSHDMLAEHNINCKIINVTKGKQLQFSKTECGVWSLVYILSRLHGHPPDWIIEVKADDTDMILYRKKLFRKS